MRGAAGAHRLGTPLHGGGDATAGPVVHLSQTNSIMKQIWRVRSKSFSDLRRQDATNFQASIESYKQAIGRMENDWQLHDRFAGALLQHGDREASGCALAACCRTHSAPRANLRSAGERPPGPGQIRAGRISLRTTASDSKPDSLEGHIGMGRVRLGQQRGPEALAEFRSAIKLTAACGSPIQSSGHGAFLQTR